MHFSTQATLNLVTYLRHEQGLDPTWAHLCVIGGADPNAILLDLRRPELEGFKFPALAYAAHTALAPGSTALQRLELMQTLIDHGAKHAEASAYLLAVYSDLWQTHPATARRMVIGLHTLHQAVAPYIDGRRTIPTQHGTPVVARPSDSDEIPF